MKGNTDNEAVLAELAALRQEVSDLRAGIPFHIHKCAEGHDWRCTSPYCDRIGRNCVAHGLGPAGSPIVAYAVDPQYARS